MSEVLHTFVGKIFLTNFFSILLPFYLLLISTNQTNQTNQSPHPSLTIPTFLFSFSLSLSLSLGGAKSKKVGAPSNDYPSLEKDEISAFSLGGHPA